MLRETLLPEIGPFLVSAIALCPSRFLFGGRPRRNGPWSAPHASTSFAFQTGPDASLAIGSGKSGCCAYRLAERLLTPSSSATSARPARRRSAPSRASVRPPSEEGGYASGIMSSMYGQFLAHKVTTQQLLQSFDGTSVGVAALPRRGVSTRTRSEALRIGLGAVVPAISPPRTSSCS